MKLNSLSDKVVFAGYKQPHELPKYYATANIFVFPTLCDTFGLVVNESLASGLPVICSKFAGALDLIQESNNGYILDPNDLGNLSNILIRLLTNDCLLAKLTHGAIESIQNFTIERCVSQFIEAIQSVL